MLNWRLSPQLLPLPVQKHLLSLYVVTDVDGTTVLVAVQDGAGISRCVDDVWDDPSDDERNQWPVK